ncbi:DNA (cytosine-5)-methyltransferase 1 [Acorus gramineus]|uniref:Cytosine-specific methyltransferase n=1 Tax=Acorus gramineus TaxID=55184 RepID=A0AAV9ARN0_ACOGR|nr:DNA (cytosine-5)-methyltransferase 1 [Acorus gramineus]
MFSADEKRILRSSSKRPTEASPVATSAAPSKKKKKETTKGSSLKSLPQKSESDAVVPSGGVDEDDMAGSDLDLEEMEGVDEGEEELTMEAEAVEEERRKPCKAEGAEKEEEVVCRFIGVPVPQEEAKERWPHRYNNEKWFDKGSLCSIVKRSFETVKDPIIKAKHHFYEAEVENCIYRVDDDVYVAGEKGDDQFIARIVEFFEGLDGRSYFTAKWFFRVEDTMIKGKHVSNHEEKRVFISEVKDDNLLECISRKVTIVQVSPDVDLVAKASKIPPCDLYYDMSYSPDFSTFAKVPSDEPEVLSGSSSTVSSPIEVGLSKDETQSNERRELTLLDIFSGCGAMSTGLCLGANESGLKLVTAFGDIPTNNDDDSDILEASEKDSSPDSEEFEVQKLIDICYGDPTNVGKDGLMFKVRWKGYSKAFDTWEPIEGLSNCEESIDQFVRAGYRAKILPLPGDVDVICGGPPCQGISGFNRFRQVDDPMKDNKNNQVPIFMDIVEYLKPKFVLMENVVDILKFAEGYIGRYAVSRFVEMNYQSKLGIMGAGCYGLPQYRLRMFLWGVFPTEQNVVGYLRDQQYELQREIVLEDAISDLPPVTNDEIRDEMTYLDDPKTDLQFKIRALKDGCTLNSTLYDHRPLRLNEDDYLRVCQIPKHKGANFRNLPGVRVRANNVVELDPNVERVYLPSKKPLVPDYAITFVKGKSSKPFGRLWWDETVATVVTRAEPHNQIIIHPVQDRVLTIRENARLQGFPDWYKLFGPIKERYIQVGNAVAVPVAQGLGYALGMAVKGLNSEGHVMTLSKSFSTLRRTESSSELEEVDLN